MKKALVILTAVCMMFAFSASAFAMTFSDMDKANDVTKDAVNKAAALEIINGYTDGTFKPEATITRAEFAKVACIAAGLKSSGEVLQGTKSQFKDVATNQWYTGWVNLANSKGFLKGYEDGTFKPNQTISNQEVITVFMRMLGYSDKLVGPWPIDYINQAAKLDIMEDVNFVGAAASTRGNVAVMLSVVLDQKLVEYSKDIEDFQNKTPEKTLLADSFKGGTTNTITFNSLSVKDFDKKTFTQNGYTVELADTAYTGGFNMFNIANHQGTIIFSKDSKEVMHAKFIQVDSKKLSTTAQPTVVGKKIKFDGKEYNVQKDVKITLPTTKNTYFYAYINEDGEIYDVTNDISNPENKVTANLVKKVDATANKVTFAGESAKTMKDADNQFIKDGKYITLADIKVGDVLNQKLGEDIYVVDAGKTGKLNQYTSTTVTIDGVKYLQNAFELYDGDFEKITKDLKDYVGTDVKVAINGNNKIKVGFATTTTATTTMYGVVTDYGTPSGAYKSETINDVTLFNQEGKTVTYKVKADVLNANHAKADAKTADVGCLLEYRLDADGVIKAATVVKLTTGDYIANAGTTINSDQHAFAVKDNKYITIDTKVYSVGAKAPVFAIDVKDKKVSVKLLTGTDLLKGSKVKCADLALAHGNAGVLDANLFAVKDGSQLKAVAVVGLGSVSDSLYGFIEDYNFTSADYNHSVKFYGDDKVYELANASQTGFAVDSLYAYTVSGDVVTLAGANLSVFGNAQKVDDFTDNIITFKAAVDGKTQMEVNKDTKIFVVDGDTITVGTEANISTSDSAIAKHSAEADKANEAVYVVVYKDGKNPGTGGGTVVANTGVYVAKEAGVAGTDKKDYFGTGELTKATTLTWAQYAVVKATIEGTEIKAVTPIAVQSATDVLVQTVNGKTFTTLIAGNQVTMTMANDVVIYTGTGATTALLQNVFAGQTINYDIDAKTGNVKTIFVK